MAGMWEERWNPLRQEWMIVAAHRQNRPWLGGTVAQSVDTTPAYVDSCYLCPGNPRVSGARNPAYTDVYVFDNDHPCVGPNAPDAAPTGSPLFKNRDARGKARVVCYDPRHNVTLAEQSAAQIETLLRVWADEYRSLGSLPEVNGILTFENKGEVIGVSNPHPHCQIYATNFVFKTIETELAAQAEYQRHEGRPMMPDILAAELADGRRILAENDGAVTWVPYFGRWAYELFVAPRATRPSLAHFDDDDFRATAEMLRIALVKLDNLWGMSMPYLMTLHQAPTDGGDYPYYHFYIQIKPPMRQPNLVKYLAGPEIGGGNFLSDTCPEDKALELQAVPTIHYKQKGC